MSSYRMCLAWQASVGEPLGFVNLSSSIRLQREMVGCTLACLTKATKELPRVVRGKFNRFNLPLNLEEEDRKSTRLNSSHLVISYAVFCLKKKKNELNTATRTEINTLNST